MGEPIELVIHFSPEKHWNNLAHVNCITDMIYHCIFEIRQENSRVYGSVICCDLGSFKPFSKLVLIMSRVIGMMISLLSPNLRILSNSSSIKPLRGGIAVRIPPRDRWSPAGVSGLGS